MESSSFPNDVWYILQVAAEQECLEQVPKAVERGRSKQTEAKATTDPGVEQSSESMKLKALRAVIDSGALSISMKSVQQITTRKTAHRKRRLFKAPKFSYDEKLKILMSQACSSAPCWIPRGVGLRLSTDIVAGGAI